MHNWLIPSKCSVFICLYLLFMYDPTWYAVVEEQIAVNISFGLFPGNKEFAWAQHFETQSSRSWN